MRKPSSLAELKRKQTTAVVLLGVIGAEFGQDISTDCKRFSLCSHFSVNGFLIFSHFDSHMKNIQPIARNVTQIKDARAPWSKDLALATIIWLVSRQWR